MFDCGCSLGVSRFLGFASMLPKEPSEGGLDGSEPSANGQRFLDWLRKIEVDVVVFDMDCTMGSGHCGGGILKEAAPEYIAGASPDFVEALRLLAAEPDLRLAVATNSDPEEYNLEGQSHETHILGPDLATELIKHWCPEALPKFEVMVGYDPSLPEHADDPMLPGKTWHMRKIADFYGVAAKRMVLFDDSAPNLETDDGWRGVLIRDGHVGFQFADCFADDLMAQEASKLE
ncbi:unnamed protein product, partial [Symbiodinium pilosum]